MMLAEHTAAGLLEPPDLAELEARLDAILAGSPYQDYAYCYPHKTAYRPLVPRRPLAQVWTGKDALALYFHLPFCERRCGSCNLFTATDPRRELVAPYLAALQRQAEAAADALGRRRITRLAMGGGTPTFLSADELDRVFDISGIALLDRHFIKPRAGSVVLSEWVKNGSLKAGNPGCGYPSASSGVNV
jgi:hypothetical protein